MIDHAAPILQNATGMDDSQRADIHDIFHGSKDPAELQQALVQYGVAEPVRSDLVTAKHRALGTAPTGDETLDKGFAIIDKLGGADEAEKHPNVTKALISLAAKSADNRAAAAQGASTVAGSGKQASNVQKKPGMAPPPRPDGLPALPPIPEGHHRILASDGGIHDVPVENIEQARQIDPNMHVLNP